VISGADDDSFPAGVPQQISGTSKNAFRTGDWVSKGGAGLFLE